MMLENLFYNGVITMRTLLIFVIMFSIIATETTFASTTKQRTVCIDAGHQLHGDPTKEANSPFTKIKKASVTSGATGRNSHVPEFKITLAIAKLVQSQLIKQNINVVMTRETHNVKISNKQRATICNDAHAEAVIRIHADSSTNQKMHGIRLLYPATSAIHNKQLAESSRKIAQYVLDRTIQATGATSLGVSTRSDLTGFNWSNVPVALIETGFLSNSDEDQLLNDEAYQILLASGIAEGIETFLNPPKDVKAK